MSVETTGLFAASLLGWVALVYLIMALGVRRGELVWSGRQPRLLDPELRVWSFLYGFLLVLSAAVLLMATDAVGIDLIAPGWMRSATFSVTAFLGVAFLLSLARGSTWERMLFAPITLAGAVLAGWLTFG